VATKLEVVGFRQKVNRVGEKSTSIAKWNATERAKGVMVELHRALVFERSPLASSLVMTNCLALPILSFPDALYLSQEQGAVGLLQPADRPEIKQTAPC
jgi:hypothetical protein